MSLEVATLAELDSANSVEFMLLDMTILAKVEITRHAILVKAPYIADS